jgi:hypothetical protein
MWNLKIKSIMWGKAYVHAQPMDYAEYDNDI